MGALGVSGLMGGLEVWGPGLGWGRRTHPQHLVTWSFVSKQQAECKHPTTVGARDLGGRRRRGLCVPTPGWGLLEQKTWGSRARTHCLKGEKKANKAPQVPPPDLGRSRVSHCMAPLLETGQRGAPLSHDRVQVAQPVTTYCHPAPVAPRCCAQQKGQRKGHSLLGVEWGAGLREYGGGELWILRPGSDRVGVQALDSGG